MFVYRHLIYFRKQLITHSFFFLELFIRNLENKIKLGPSQLKDSDKT